MFLKVVNLHVTHINVIYVSSKQLKLYSFPKSSTSAFYKWASAHYKCVKQRKIDLNFPVRVRK
jgi:hypothetical protein